MKIVVDKNIPFIRKPLEGLGDVIYLKGDAITPDIMHDADILLTRTRTRCDERLLDGSRCKFIGTATIGTDHIDLEYCKHNGITVANAPGCNAPAVAQYVFSAIIAMLPKGEKPEGKIIGIIGVGHVGSIVAKWGESLGLNVLLYDPPKYGDNTGTEYGGRLTTLAEISEKSDIVTIHTPLTRSGKYPTYHLIDKEFLDSLKRKPLLINAARGGVMDTTAVKDAIREGIVSGVAVDCWENEPKIDLELLDMVNVGTPHIAGYSYEGKVRATAMILDALTDHLKGEGVAPAPLEISLRPVPESISQEMLSYDILADSAALKASTSGNPTAETFEQLRDNYNLRHEPGQAFQILTNHPK